MISELRSRCAGFPKSAWFATLTLMVLFRKSKSGFYVAHNATLTGELEIGPDCSFWFGTVVRGDVAKITIGARTNVQDNAVVHCDGGVDMTIGDDVVIGHGAIVHGEYVGSGSLIGMGATVLSRSRIGKECLVAAGAVVPPGFEAPDRSLVVGVPAKVARPLNEKDFKYMQFLASHYVQLAQKHVSGEIKAFPLD